MPARRRPRGGSMTQRRFILAVALLVPGLPTVPAAGSPSGPEILARCEAIEPVELEVLAATQGADAGKCFPAVPGAQGCERAWCLPRAIILGVQKAGTREVIIWLSQSSMVHAAAEELNYFPRVAMQNLSWLDYARRPKVASATHRQEHDGRSRKVSGPHSDREDAFLLTAEEIAAGHVTMEKSPQYTTFGTKSKTTASGLHLMLPSARLIIILRDPSQRAYSAFHHNCAKGRIPNYCLKKTKGKPLQKPTSSGQCTPQTFDCMVNYTVERLNRAHDGHGQCHGSACFVLLSGLYADIIGDYIRPTRFARNQVLIALSESLIANMTAEMDRILHHVFETPERAARARPDAWGHAYRTERGFTVLPNTPESKANNPSDPAYTPMLPSTAKTLQAFYADGNRKLRQMLPELRFPNGTYL